MRVPFSTHPLQHLLLVDFFDDSHSDWCEVIPHCSFDWHVSNNKCIENLFMCLLAICISLEKCLFKFSDHFDWVVCFSGIQLRELLVYFGD